MAGTDRETETGTQGGTYGGADAAIPWSRRAIVRAGAVAGAAAIGGPLRALGRAAGATAGAVAADPITALGARALSAAIHARTLSCVDVMRAFLDRIDRINPKVNAIVSLQPRAGLLAMARAMDDDLAAGRDRGLLHGLPLAVKDLEPVQGLPFTEGSPIYRDRIAQRDGTMVARMRAAGGIFIGKTNTPEFGLGSNTYNPVFGITRNPYDGARSAGGSSGGAGVAIATHMLALADGSDWSGSLRNPAAWNNIYALRPTFGLVPESGGFIARPWVNGPLARTPDDLGFFLAVLAGAEPGAPLTIDADPARFLGPLDRPVRGTKIGWLGNFGALPMEAGVMELCRAALDRLAGEGAEIVDVAVPSSLPEMWDAWVTLRSWVNAHYMGALLDDPKTRDLLKPEAQWEIRHGRTLSADAVAGAFDARARWYRAFAGLFDRVDFLATPSAQLFPFDLAMPWPREIAGVAMDSYHRWMEVDAAVSMAGCPVAAVPVGFGERGLPMGMQLIGPIGRDLDCLKLAASYDGILSWPKLRPPPV